MPNLTTSEQESPAQRKKRADEEAALAAILIIVLGETYRAFQDMPAGEIPDSVWSDMSSNLSRSLQPQLRAAMLRSAESIARQVSEYNDDVADAFAKVEDELNRQSTRQAAIVANQLARARRSSANANRSQPLDVRLYNTERANQIAITENTRSITIGGNTIIDELYGPDVERVWMTEQDDAVCSVCSPLHGVSSDEWPAAQNNGPPAHVNCRCSVLYAVDDNIIGRTF